MNMKDEMQWATDLLAKYPKTKSLMEEWAKNELKSFQSGLMSELSADSDVTIPEITEEMASQYGMVLLAANQYSVLDFLDANKYYINLEINTANSRKLATKQAIEKGFEFLNN